MHGQEGDGEPNNVTKSILVPTVCQISDISVPLMCADVYIKEVS